jgi:hypothetical protein
VNYDDYTLFASTFGSESDIPDGPPAYIITMDFNLDAFVDAIDYSAFVAHYGADWVF